MAVIEKKKFEESEEEVLPDLTPKKNSSCIVCGAKAEFCMRGLPKNTYCRECAEAYFGLLEYLDQLESQN
jgi:hypothetical protein